MSTLYAITPRLTANQHSQTMSLLKNYWEIG